MIQKNGDETDKEDIEELIYSFNKKFSKDGQETNTTADHKKILKNFYRWLKFDSRNQKPVGLESRNQERTLLQVCQSQKQKRILCLKHVEKI